MPALRILVTGGAGYVGSHALVELLGAGHQVHVLDNLATGHGEALARAGALAGREFGFTRADIRDTPAVARLAAAFAPEAVVHFAGLKSPVESLAEPAQYFEVNVAGTRSLMAALRPTACRRMVFSSSAAVYGPPRMLPLPEDHGLRPTTPYGRTKQAVEALLTEEPGWSVASLRYFNPAGAHPSARLGEATRGPAANLVPRILEVTAGRQPALEVTGTDYPTPDGSGLRDFVHVQDVARAHLAALDWTGRGAPSTAFNIGTGRPVSVLELVAAFAAATGRSVPVRRAQRREGDVAASWADPSRAADLLGWRAREDLAAMCASAVAFAVANPDGYGSAQAMAFGETIR